MSAVEPAVVGAPDLSFADRDRVGQATAIEQQRAVAEVQAMVVVAQQVPRDLAAAVAAMRESCRMKALAQRAFFRYPRGGQQITGASVHLARELARCFGNVTYGLVELRRDDVAGESEMQAFAWDLQTNTRSSSTFVVPHRRDTQQGPKVLVDVRDVYENNANQGARRLRETIFSVLPPWYVEEAKAICAATLEADEDGVPLPQRIANTINAFERRFGVVADQIEAKLGRPRARWTGHDLATLEVIGTSLSRGETVVEDEFPSPRVTAGEILGQQSSPPSGGAQADQGSPAEAVSPPAPAGATTSGEEGGFSAGADGPSSPDHDPPPADETWKAHADRVGVEMIPLMRALKARWPDGRTAPSNSKKIDEACVEPALAELVHETIDQLAGRAGA